MFRRLGSKSWPCRKLAVWPWASYNSQLLLRVMRGPTVTMKCPSAQRAGTAVPLSSLAPPGSPLTLSGPPWLWKFPSLPLPFRIKFTPTWLHRMSHRSFGIHPILHTSPEASRSFPPPCPSPSPSRGGTLPILSAQLRGTALGKALRAALLLPLIYQLVLLAPVPATRRVSVCFHTCSCYYLLGSLRPGTIPTQPSIPNSQGSTRILDWDLFGRGNLLRLRVVTSLSQSPKSAWLQIFEIKPMDKGCDGSGSVDKTEASGRSQPSCPQPYPYMEN